MASKILLEEAARRGQIDVLNNLLKENPSILIDHKLLSLSESLLHVATKSGHLNIVRELMKIDPDTASEMNNEGFRPLDIAVITGNIDIFKEILNFNQDLCRLRGKERRTALHYATLKGRVHVLDELMCRFPDCIRDVTVHGETALHLAVKSYQFDAFERLVKGIKRMEKASIFNIGDGDGNTVLHVAVSTKQYACIDILVGENNATKRTIQVNAKNADGLTPLDLLSTQDSSHGIKIARKLERAGAIKSPHSTSTIITTKNPKPTTSLKPNHVCDDPSKNWFEYFKFQTNRDSPSDTRNALLVVAALIATVCFQAGADPPNSILEKPPEPSRTNTPPPPAFLLPGGNSALAATSAILGSHATSYLFLFANTLGLNASMCIIIYLTTGFPFQRELHIALYSMMFAYGFTVNAAVEGVEPGKKATANVLVVVAFVLPFAQRWLPRWGKRGWRKWREREFRKKTLPLDS